MKPVTGNASRDSRFKSVFGNTLSSVLFRRDRLWIMLLTAAGVVLLVGWWANRSVEDAVKRNIVSQLETLLEADVAALQVWMGSEQMAAKAFGRRDDVIALVEKLREIASNEDSVSIKADLLSSESLIELRETVGDWGSEYGALGFLVIDKNFRVLAGEQDDGIGDTELAKEYATKLQPVLDGESAFFYPTRSRRAFEDVDGVRRAGIPVMYVVAPIPSADGSENAVFGLRLRPEETFSRLLGVASFGETGETYAFNREGVMLTNSRFDNELKRIGLLVDEQHSRSLLNISIRDPGVNMTKGLRPKLSRSEQPLTRMAQHAIESGRGHDIGGYRDYRGVPVVGAWTWLPEYDIGVATEVDVDEAYQPLYALRRAFWILTGLLGLAALVNGWLAFYASKMEYKAREAAVSAKRLGQYSLGNKLGEGGMGTVYRANHDLLRRPTAVKLLNIEKTNEQTIARFEREVQLTSQLTHPNTIAIYDYGRTPEGVFYYAMEYLEGFELVDLIKQHGPQSPGRVIFILKQVCKSLAEAHAQQLIHRDIKPGNIMLTHRGGMGDFVKLLDFGLVKSQQDSLHVTAADSILGTPHYMPPEVMTSQELDARSDLYSLGGVAYYLLTAKTIFEGNNIAEVCMKHARDTPVSPSERLGKPIDQDLEKIVLGCLEKERDNRPQSANALWEALDSCSASGTWSQRDADSWWSDKLSGAMDTDDFRMGVTQRQAGDLDETMDQADWDQRSGKADTK